MGDFSLDDDLQKRLPASVFPTNPRPTRRTLRPIIAGRDKPKKPGTRLPVAVLHLLLPHRPLTDAPLQTNRFSN